MKEIIKKWCQTNSLSTDELSALIREYLSYDNRNITNEEIQGMFELHMRGIQINIEKIATIICLKNNWILESISYPNTNQSFWRMVY